MLAHERVMTDEEFAGYFAKAQELSEFFREIGPKYDVDNTFAYPSIKAFKESGLGKIGVPKEFGGPGGNILQMSKVVTEMSRGRFSHHPGLQHALHHVGYRDE